MPATPAREVEMLAAPLLKKDGGAMETWACFLPVMTSARPKMAFSMDTKKSAMALSALCNRQGDQGWPFRWVVQSEAASPLLQ